MSDGHALLGADDLHEAADPSLIRLFPRRLVVRQRLTNLHAGPQRRSLAAR